MKSDINAENDKANRVGTSAVYKSLKLKTGRKIALKDEETKQKTLDFIFGKVEIGCLSVFWFILKILKKASISKDENTAL